MGLDPKRFPRVPAQILAGISQPDVLLTVGPGSIAILRVPTPQASSTWSGFSPDDAPELIELASKAGATVIDARKCCEDAYRHLVITGPMVEVGGLKSLRITGERHAMGTVSIADYAPLYAAIGAIVHNMPAPTGEPAEIAA
ncbi:hypothetical protein [Aureimonas sp. SK2]|uniref:hypothetical protein n=1 Tax=Aureimonas sp. SK2 TaxID=3015992 RepID=UPI002444DF5D|nr:hypothetical protein [Aureimonas sp. SK2]